MARVPSLYRAEAVSRNFILAKVGILLFRVPLEWAPSTARPSENILSERVIFAALLAALDCCFLAARRRVVTEASIIYGGVG